MTLPATNPRLAYVGNNTTGTYAWTWIVYQATDLHVAVLNPQSALTVLALGSDYSIQNPILQIDANSGGNIILSASGFFAFNNGVLPAGWAIIIRRAVVFDQTTTLDSQGLYDPAAVEGQLDYLTMQTLQLQDAVAHCLQTPLDDYVAPSQNIATAALRAGGYVLFDANGNVYSTPALIEGVPAGGTTYLGIPAVTLSNLAEGLSDLVNQTLPLTSTDGATYSWSVNYGIYRGMLATVIWPYTSTTTTPVIKTTCYQAPSRIITNVVVNKDGTALTNGQLVAGTAAVLYYDGTYWRLMA